MSVAALGVTRAGPSMQNTLLWRLVNLEGRFSIARLHLLLGGFYLLLSLIASALPESSVVPGIRSVSGFFIAMIIVTAGALAWPLEARLVRLPARLRAWAVSSGRSKRSRRSENTAPDSSQGTQQAEIARWALVGDQGTVDAAVFQLAIGVGVVPLLSYVSIFTAIGWRMVAITTLSEIVYFSYLGARLVKLGELTDLVREIRAARREDKRLQEEKTRLDALPKDETGAGAESVTASIENVARVQAALSARADVLWRQLAFMFDIVDDGLSTRRRARRNEIPSS
jgi:hypothetical protein